VISAASRAAVETATEGFAAIQYAMTARRVVGARIQSICSGSTGWRRTISVQGLQQLAVT
jgi:hypothetical protein